MLNHDLAMYLFVNRGLGMSSGKQMSQSAHAAVEAYRISEHNDIDKWMEGKHYKKLVMLAYNTEHLLTIQKYLEDRGFKTALIIDEASTELVKHEPTALGVALVDKEDPHVRATFSTFESYREKIRFTVEVDK